MKTFSLSLMLIAVCSLLIGSARLTARSASALAIGTNDLSAATRQELAQARAGTARYHDVLQAEADGYINIDFCEPGEGCHYLNPSLIDGNFDPAQPEILLYVNGPGESGLRLVGVEYVVPLSLSQDAPEGFTGDTDVWREDSEGAGLWELNAWLWLHNPNGIFADHPHPRIP
jgi:hypothetical protein